MTSATVRITALSAIGILRVRLFGRVVPSLLGYSPPSSGQTGYRDLDVPPAITGLEDWLAAIVRPDRVPRP
ncbi:MAG: hypothetical protein N2037_01660 [Acidimicrobiales bacterium]|nr:hypothetical protein [Acidimicrobiales bacterium]